MAVDPFFSMPNENWQQTGSFFEPFDPPIDPPDGGDLVALPCINTDWLALLVGAADQLRNPSSWSAALSDSARALVISRADKLRSMLTRKGPCVNPVVSLAFDCTGGLVATLADGSHVPVSGWNTNFCTCAQGCITPATPVPVTGQTPSENSCGIATYLATSIFQQFMSVMATARQNNDVVAKWVTDIVTAITAVNPILELMALFVQNAFNTSQPQSYTDMQDAASNTALWVNVKCAILAAIFDDGHVTSANFPVVRTNIAAITFTHPWIVAMLANMWTDLGIFAIQKLQDQGALTVGDCSDCPTNWCWYMDLRAGPSGWVAESGSGGWASSGPFGAGWYQEVESAGKIGLRLHLAMPHHVIVNEVDIWLADPNGLGACVGCDRHVYLELSSTVVSTTAIPNGPYAGVTRINIPLSVSATCDQVILYIESINGASPSGLLQQVSVHGLGTNPFGPNNCPP